MVYTKIFFTGATGYVGGSILTRLLSHPLRRVLDITALVRSEEKAEKLRSLGLKAVFGFTSDGALLASLAAEADIVFACTDCDDVEANKAILAGLKARFERTGVAPSLVHTSGTGVLSVQTQGMKDSETVYSDMNIPLIETLPLSQPHRPVDIAIVEADQQGYVKTYIVAPSCIYGRATGPLVELGIQRPMSIHVPLLVKTSIARGQAGIVGAGANIWANVDIDELTDLYIILFENIFSATWTPSIKASPEFQHGRHGFYYGSNDEHRMLDLSKQLASIMNNRGIGTAEPTPFTDKELEENPLIVFTCMGANSRCTSDRSKALGWKPTKTTQDFLASIEEEFLAVHAK